MSLKLIVFDCDGTLVDSQSFIVGAMMDAFEARGLTPPAPEAARSIIGLSLTEAIEKLADPDCSKSEVEAIKQAYIQHFAKLRQDKGYSEPFYEGAITAIKKLDAHEHVLMGICTGKSRVGVNKIIEAKGLKPYMATTQAGDEHPSKPHPAMLEAAMTQTGVLAQNSVMIGDTSFDMEMGKAAGARTIGVSWGYHSADTLVRSGADSVIDHFDELYRLLFDWDMLNA